MSTLTDRYVWGVLRNVPAGRRSELDREIRALVADAIEAREAAATERDAATAERAALVELGDPDHLAARYLDQRMFLVGPRYFTEWRRLLSLLLPIVVPVATLATTGAAALAGKPAAELVGVAAGSAFQVAIQLVFWITVVFAVLERSDAAPLGTEWTPDRLPELPARRGESRAEMATAAVAIVVGTGLLIWQQLANPVVIGGAGYPVFDNALWPFWMCWFLGLLAIEFVALLARWRAGGWTFGFAVINLGTNLAFAIPALWLFGNGNLFDPGLEAAVARTDWAPGLAPTGAVLMVVVAASSAWDAIDGFRRAWLRRTGAA
jgi:hypothetical protein